MSAHNEPTVYRFISCPECKHQFSWLGSRLPNFCPECGNAIHHQLREPGCKSILIIDQDARVSYASKGGG